jgi:hypothetical protein
MGWLPIVNYAGVRGWLIMVDVSYTTLHKRISEVGWLATPSTPPPGMKCEVHGNAYGGLTSHTPLALPRASLHLVPSTCHACMARRGASGAHLIR